MKPLSRTRRLSYLTILTILFLVLVPVIIFYAKGYRPNFGGAFQVSRTGGLYIATEEAGTEIYVNNELVRKTNIVQKSVFVQDLKPGVYAILVSKAGEQTWTKQLRVFPELVTEVQSFLLKEEPTLTEIPRLLNVNTSTTSNSSQRASSKNPEYDSTLALFSAPLVRATTTNATTTAERPKPAKKILIDNVSGVLRVSWGGEEDAIPNYFCEESVCKSIIVVRTPSPVRSFDFFPGRDDLLILRLADGVYVSEIDDRSPQNIQRVVSGGEYDFRVKDGGEVYLKKGANIYSVSF